MGWNLENFKSSVESVGLNQYFKIEIPLMNEKAERVTALVRTAELPAMVHETTGVPFRGLDMKIQTKVTFNDWNVTVLCDSTHSERKAMLEWQAKMYNLDTLSNFAHTAYKQEQVTVAKVGYNGDVEATTRCHFFGIFPSTVGAVSLDQAGGQPDTFDVTFTYDYFLPADKKIEGWKGGANTVGTQARGD